MDRSKKKYQEVLLNSLKGKNIKRDKDLHELDISNCSLENVPNLIDFKNLNILHLHQNKMLRIGNGLSNNLLITELYLQHNRLLDINNTIQHLRCLKVLWLHSNQLTVLTDVVYELRLMQDLKDLNLSKNPLSQDYSYRNYVIHFIKSLEVFDFIRINDRDRVTASRQFTDDCISKGKIAFGRHVEK